MSARSGFFEELHRGVLSPFITCVNLAGRDAIADELDDILGRHLVRYNLAVLTVIDPVFPVMFVSTLVVQPYQAIANVLAFCIDWATIALVILDRCKELRRAELGQVMD